MTRDRRVDLIVATTTSTIICVAIGLWFTVMGMKHPWLAAFGGTAVHWALTLFAQPAIRRWRTRRRTR